MWCHAISCYVMRYHVRSCYVVWYHVRSCDIMWGHVMTMCKNCDQVCVLNPQVLGVRLLEKFLCPPGPEHGEKGIPEAKITSRNLPPLPPSLHPSSSFKNSMQIGLGNLWNRWIWIYGEIVKTLPAQYEITFKTLTESLLVLFLSNHPACCCFQLRNKLSFHFMLQVDES